MSLFCGGAQLKQKIQEKNEIVPETRKNQEQKLTVLKESIEERRRQVYLLDLQGFSNSEIATTLQVSLSTIEKDLHFMKYYSSKWYQEIFSTGLSNPLLDYCNQTEIVQRELWKMFRDEEKTTVRKSLLDSIISNSTKKRDYFHNYFPESFDHKGKIKQLEREIEVDLTKNST